MQITRRQLLGTPVVAAVGDRLNRGNLVQTFSDEFDALLSVYDPATGRGRWKTNWDFGDQSAASSRILNDELEVYCDAAYNGVNPFHVENGILAITADVNRNTSDSRTGGKPYTSGMISSAKSFTQKYGHFEFRAKLAQGAGLWNILWLYAPFHMPITEAQYPGEIDILEMLGKDPGTIYCSSVWATDSTLRAKAFKTIPVPVGGTDKFRTYGVLWSARTLSYYVDDYRVAQMPTNAMLNVPMFIMANLAVGGAWGGPPNADTQFPKSLSLDFVRAYRVVE